MSKLSIKLFQICSVLFCSSNLYSMSQTKLRLGLNPKQLKGTHTVLQDYSGCSPFYGLVLLDKGVLRNLYEFSSFYNKTLGDGVLKNAPVELEPLKKDVQDYFAEDRSTGTQNLVRQMFHMPPGGTFNPTNAPNNPVAQFTPKDIGKILRIVYDTQHDAVKMETDVKGYLQGLGIKDPKGKAFAPKDFNPFVKSLVKAIRECDEKNPEALFATNTAQSALLGYLLIKSNERKDLQNYFYGFLGKDVTLSDELYSAQEIAKLSTVAPDLKNLESFANFVCATVYQQLYSGDLPKIITSNMGVGFKGVEFTDCMECVMRNLCNIATYSSKDKVLGIAPEGAKFDTTLQEFYAKHSDANNITNETVHQDWVSVVENVSGVSYNRLCNVSGGSINVPFDCAGFIPVATVDSSMPVQKLTIGASSYFVYEKMVGDRKFLLVPHDSGAICCELMPSVRNIIILMNTLFNLNLYSESDAIFSVDFEQNYLNSMCEKFAWSVQDSGNLTKSVSLSVATKFKQEFSINLSDKAHGYVKLQESQKENVGISGLFDDASVVQQAIGTALGLCDIEKSFKNDFYYDLIDPNNRVSRVKIMMDRENGSRLLTDNLIVSIGFLQDMHYLQQIQSANVDLSLKAKKIMGTLNLLKYADPSILDVRLYSSSEIISIINCGLKRTNLSDEYYRLARKAIDENILTVFNSKDIISWIQTGIDRESCLSSVFFSLIKIAQAKDILNNVSKSKIFSWLTTLSGLKPGFGPRSGPIGLCSFASKVIEKSSGVELQPLDIINFILNYVKNLNGKSAEKLWNVLDVAIDKKIISSADVCLLISKIVDIGEVEEGLSLAKREIDAGVLGQSNTDEILSWMKHAMNVEESGLFARGGARSHVPGLAFDLIRNGWLKKSEASFLLSVVVAGIQEKLFGQNNYTVVNLFHEMLAQNFLTNGDYNQIRNVLLQIMETERKNLFDANIIINGINRGLLNKSDLPEIESFVATIKEKGRNYSSDVQQEINESVQKLEALIQQKFSNQSGSMMDLARGAGGLRPTTPNLMRYQPSYVPKQFAAVSQKQLEQQRVQLEKFNEKLQQQNIQVSNMPSSGAPQINPATSTTWTTPSAQVMAVNVKRSMPKWIKQSIKKV